jgi:hypothetical protein
MIPYTVTNNSIVNALVVLLLICPVARSQMGTPVDPKWDVTIAGKDRRPNKGVNCHPLQYFLDSNNLKEFDFLGPYPADIRDSVRSERQGEVNGFAIYNVIHEIEDGDRNVPGENFPFPPTILKMVLAERKPGDFCEIYHEQDDRQGLTVTPSYFVEVDSEKVLVTRDRVPGTGNEYNEAYWTFDEKGPILLDSVGQFSNGAVHATAEKLLPSGMRVRKGGGFDIQTLSYEMGVWQEGDANCCPTGGSVHIRFALKDHRLVVVSQEYSKLCPVDLCHSYVSTCTPIASVCWGLSPTFERFFEA